MSRSTKLMRRLDRLIGSAAASIAPLLRPRSRTLPSAPRRIVLIQPTAIGDTLISSSCIAALADLHPEARLILVHGLNNSAIVPMLAAPVQPMLIGFRNPAGAVRRLRALEADLIVDLCPWPYVTALAARLSAPCTAGFSPPGSRRGQLFDVAVPHLTDRHEIQNLAAMAAALGAKARPGMAIRRDRKAMPEGIHPSGLVLFHIAAGGARAAEKAWPGAHWRVLACELLRRGYRVAFTGVAADNPKIEVIISGIDAPPGRLFSLAGRLDLRQLAELLAAVDLLVSVDTGVLHLSAAVGGRAVGLHGPTRSTRWGSISPLAHAIDAPHGDAGYIHYGWETHPAQSDIMPAILPDTVLEAAGRVLVGRKGAA